MNQNKIDTKQLCRRTLSSDAYLSVNKYLIYKLGLKEAVLLADLISKHEYFENKGVLDDEGFFFNTRKDRKSSTCLSYDLQYRIVKSLTQSGLLETKRKSIPAKTYFKINYDMLGQLLSEPRKQEDETSGSLAKTNDLSQSKDFTYSGVRKQRSLINKNNSNKASLKNPKEANNAQQSRASLSNERIDHGNTTIVTPRPNRKSSLLSKGSHEPIKMKTSTYVEHWNNLDNVTHHSYFNNKDQPSKTYLTASKLCSQLNRGMFNNNPIDKTFLLKHKINRSLLTRKFTKKEIEKVLTNLSTMFAPGHWAGNGSNLRPNLPLLLYNPMNKSSMFLAMFANPGLADKTLEYIKPTDNYPQLTSKIVPLLDKRPKGNKQTYIMLKGIESIVKYHKTIKINSGKLGLRNINTWINYYTDFLDCCCNSIEVRHDMIRTGNWLWDRFLNEYEDEWYIDPNARNDYSGDIV
jgi:hypothetical protein